MRSGCRLILVLAVLSMLTAGPALGAETWRIGTWKTAQTIQPFFYQPFAPPGVEVQVSPFSNPGDQKAALLAGSLDMCGTTLALAIQAASRGEPVTVVAALCNKCSALVVKKDGPLASVKDLKGRAIGTVPGTMHEILLRETLVRNGLNPDKDVKLTRVDFFDMGLALARGDIDAFLSGEPFPTRAVVEGYGRVLAYPYYGGSIGTLNAAMLVRRDLVQKNPDLVYAMVRAHLLATRHLQANPRTWLERAATFGTDLKVLEQASPNMELAGTMDEAFVRRVRALGERMAALKLIDRQPDYRALVDLSFVQRFEREQAKGK